MATRPAASSGAAGAVATALLGRYAARVADIAEQRAAARTRARDALFVEALGEIHQAVKTLRAQGADAAQAAALLERVAKAGGPPAA